MIRVRGSATTYRSAPLVASLQVYGPPERTDTPFSEGTEIPWRDG
jgi:hypothetical protein